MDTRSAISKINCRMVVQGQLVEPAVCFSNIQAYEELIHSLLDRSQVISCLDSKHFFNIYPINQKVQFMIFTLANDHFIV